MPRRGRRSRAMRARCLKKKLSNLSSITAPGLHPQTCPQPGDVLMTDDGPSCSSYPVTQLPPLLHEGPQIEERQHVRSVRATHCQSDRRYDEFSRNHQCTCMALTFLAYHYEGSQFNPDELDRVLHQGDSLYVAIKKQLVLEGRYRGNHLTLEEMPMHILTDTNTYSVCMPFMWCGSLQHQEDGPAGWGLLANQLRCLSTDVSHALLIVSPECVAVFRHSSGRYGLFDSHSRSAAGLPHPRGSAIMLTFDHLTDMIDHLHQLFKGRRDNASYEFVPVSFSTDISVVPLPTATAQPQETESQTALSVPQTESVMTQTYSRDVGVVKFEDVEANNPEHNVKNCSELSQQQQRRYIRRERYQYEKNKYATCPEYRLKKLQAMKTNCAQKNQNPSSVEGKKATFEVRLYDTDPALQNRQKKNMTERLDSDSDVQNTKDTTQMYACDQDRSAQTGLHSDAAFSQRCSQNHRNQSPANAAFHLQHKWQRAVKIKRKYRLIVVHCPADPQPQGEHQVE